MANKNILTSGAKLLLASQAIVLVLVLVCKPRGVF